MSSTYATCVSSFGVPSSGSANLTEFIACISDTQDATTQGVSDGVNSFFLLYGGALVFSMQIGFAMLCAGFIRAKNVKNVILWNMLDSCGGGVAFWAVGYAFAFGGETITGNAGGNKTWIGSYQFFLRNDYTSHTFWLYEWAFASALSSIVAGTIAERTKMVAYLIYSAFLVGFVYPVVAHAFWSYNGFLSNAAVHPLFGIGAIDFAGSGPVHFAGGVAALAAGIVLGPRRGRFHDDNGNLLEKPAEIPAHNIALSFLGTFLLWFGWYGFNPCSTVTITSTASAQTSALAACNTTLGACAGALTALYISVILSVMETGVAHWDVAWTMNGCLAGLVAITGPCASVPTWAGCLIGVGAGVVYVIGNKTMLFFRIDDAVDAVPVHMFGGLWGMIATGLFSRKDLINRGYALPNNIHQGWFFSWGAGSGDAHLLACQVVGAIFIFCWVFVTMFVLFSILKALGLYRVDPIEEEVGLDISRHNGAAYDHGSVKAEAVEELNRSRSKSGYSGGKTYGDEMEKEVPPSAVAEDEA